jgi:hypothetical protein
VGKRKDKNKSKQRDARSQDAKRDIARAEKRLAAALEDLDDARAKLTKREAKLAGLLREHGRLPEATLAPAEPFAADNGASETSNAAAAARVDLALAEAVDAQAEAVRSQSESAFGLPGRTPDER